MIATSRNSNRAVAPQTPVHCLLLLALLLPLALSASGQTLGTALLAWKPSPGPGVAGYRLYQGTASRTYSSSTNTGNVTNTTVAGLTAGLTYFFAVTALGTNGLESQFSNEINYTVPATNNVPPAIALTAPANGSSYTAPATINLAASVTANGHTITQVQFYNGATFLGSAAAAPYSLTWGNVGAGSYSIAAKVVYDAGSTVGSTISAVTVSNPVAPPPSTVSFAASSGTISSPFSVNGGLVSQTVDTEPSGGGHARYTFAVPATGDYLVSAVVNAPSGAANSFFINIDSEPADPLMIWDIIPTSGLTNRTVSWRGTGSDGNDQFTPKVFNLSQGTHQLIVRGREPNVQLGTITIAPAATLPAPWQVLDIGNVGITGSAVANGSLYTVAGAGVLGGLADSFRFMYQPMTGDGEIRARVNSLQNSSMNACAGVMIRETLTAGSSYSLMGISPNGTYRSQKRNGTATSTVTTTSGAGVWPNVWARLVRTGNTLTGYKSSDGTNWISVDSTAISMATNVYLGFAVASGATNAATTATFTNATIVP